MADRTWKTWTLFTSRSFCNCLRAQCLECPHDSDNSSVQIAELRTTTRQVLNLWKQSLGIPGDSERSFQPKSLPNRSDPGVPLGNLQSMSAARRIFWGPARATLTIHVMDFQENLASCERHVAWGSGQALRRHAFGITCLKTAEIKKRTFHNNYQPETICPTIFVGRYLPCDRKLLFHFDFWKHLNTTVM